MLKKIVKYSTAWCGPCRMMKPIFREVSEMEKYSDITFEEMDVETDKNGEVECAKYSIRNVPTMILFDENDDVIVKVSGAMTKDRFTKLIDERM